MDCETGRKYQSRERHHCLLQSRRYQTSTEGQGKERRRETENVYPAEVHRESTPL